jgi:hypothetical protein
MSSRSHTRSLVLGAAAAVSSLLFYALSAGAADDPPSAAESAERGLTTPSIILVGDWEEDGDLATFEPPLFPEHLEPSGGYFPPNLREADWELVDQDTFQVILPVGEACPVRFDYSGDSLVVIAPPDPVVALAWQAIDYAPDWLARDLQDSFSRLSSARQEVLAQLILDTSDPIVDEVAFVVAHLASEPLTSSALDDDLLIENAEDVYAHDSYLDYVDIVDYGSAAGGGDYYSTVRYRTAAAGDTSEVELPRDRYYWDIVHLKITDEFPKYVDPATGVGTPPPLGRFWREFLFTHADSGYPVLRDELAGCEVLWEGNVDSQTNGAIGIITGWVQDVLDFGSGGERPIQPVRIYHLHLGRCGEHADFTAAAARAALIATNSPLAPDEDHTWNEFYDQRWVPWEPVNNYVDSGWHYEGWGKSFIGIFNWRGDDWTWTVTQRYTPSCTLTVTATDTLGHPVDGAMVKIGRKIADYSYVLSTWGYTDYNGMAEFVLGDSNDVYCRIESAIGNFPSGPLYRRPIEAAEAGQHYYWSKSVVGERPGIPIQPATLPASRSDQYRIDVRWDVAGEYVYGENYYDHNTFAEYGDNGAIAFFICDENEYASYAAADSFSGYEYHQDASTGNVSFVLPTGSDWYAVLSNEEHLVDKQIVNVAVELYSREPTDVALVDEAASLRLALERNAPNPFGPSTSISYSLPQESFVRVAVYDVSGRLVKRLVTGAVPAGKHETRWDGTDMGGRPVSGGVYFCCLETQGRQLHRKMVLVR